MADILKEVLKNIPDNITISESGFEGANIVLYTKSKEFFLDNNGVIKDIVNSIKKRVEVRLDPTMTLDQEKAEKKIREIIPKETGDIEIISMLPSLFSILAVISSILVITGSASPGLVG